jgi:hypothetical protein
MMIPAVNEESGDSSCLTYQPYNSGVGSPLEGSPTLVALIGSHPNSNRTRNTFIRILALSQKWTVLRMIFCSFWNILKRPLKPADDFYNIHVSKWLFAWDRAVAIV